MYPLLLFAALIFVFFPILSSIQSIGDWFVLLGIGAVVLVVLHVLVLGTSADDFNDWL